VLTPISLPGLSTPADLQLPKLDETAPATDGGQGSGFGGLLGNAIQKLDGSLQQATESSNALATGQATDVTQVVNDVQRASLELQLATQVRNKAVDAYQEIFRMQI
jgi:flagellar hook-basal body complex protein FliE